MNFLYFTITFLLLSSISRADDKPNILWLTSEDNNVTWVGCYGNPYAETPHIDKLATEGFQYMHCYANAPVCASQRSTWITGVHSLSMGTHPMRSRNEIPHDKIKYYPDFLRKAGYYCANYSKTDYNIGGRVDNSCWDSNKLNWETLKQKQPFFQVINTSYSHESRAFGDVNKATHDPTQVKLAKYHPDIPDIRKNYALYHDAVKKMDAYMGRALESLEENGLAENTIVIYNSDHGGVLPRSKRFLFNSGTHCPLIIRMPEKFKHLWPVKKPGTKVDRLVSFIDMTKTWLALTGAETPAYLQGRIFLGPKAQKEREYHVSFRTRMDERCDNVRALRNKKFLYIRNYMPYAPRGQRLRYLWKMTATQAWVKHHKEGKTNALSARFFESKAMEELYDTSKDPDNVNNLINEPEYKELIAQMRIQMNSWQDDNFDAGMLPESEIVKRAADNNTTIYELVRNKSLYDLAAYRGAANLAIEKDPNNLGVLMKNVNHADCGVRYWGVTGLFLLLEHVDAAVFEKLLTDESHHVRIMAAWALYKKGKKQQAIELFNKLLKNDSYASLKICNIIDWIGDGFEPYKESLKHCQYSHNGYVGRMKEYFGLDVTKE